MTKKTTRKKFNKGAYKKRIDSLWSKIVRTRDKKCMICGSTESLQAHHCIVRKAQGNATRWDARNGITLCYRCHILEIHGYATESILSKYMNVINSLYTEDEKYALRLKSKAIIKDNQATLELIHDKLKRELDHKTTNLLTIM